MKTIGNYERGKSSPDPKRLSMIARALGVGADELMGEGKEPRVVPNGGHRWLPYVPDWDGTPVEMGGHGFWPVPSGLGAGEACLVMRVADNAMRPFLMAGDAIVVDPNQTRLRSLVPMVVRVDGKVLIRLYVALKGLEILLAPRNSFDPIVVRPEHEVLARVVAIVDRNLRTSMPGPATR